MNRKQKRDIIRRVLFFAAGVLFPTCLFSTCDLYEYGQIGGADKTGTFYPYHDMSSDVFENTMSFISGVWYSHYAGVGMLDGYRIGKWKDFKKLVEDSGKAALFPNLVKETYTTETGSNTPDDEDFFVFYDDTVYGQTDDSTGGNGGWGNLVTRYIGIVRAVNIFNNDTERGAIIVEYFKGCAPLCLDRWPESEEGKRPFFGIYYRILDGDVVQLANAVDLAALNAGKKYYTETAHLDEAIAFNNVENEAEFISWGVVIPQDREK
jgi:hypothetical protein